jgi:hypothetical protein
MSVFTPATEAKVIHKKPIIGATYSPVPDVLPLSDGLPRTVTKVDSRSFSDAFMVYYTTEWGKFRESGNIWSQWMEATGAALLRFTPNLEGRRAGELSTSQLRRGIALGSLDEAITDAMTLLEKVTEADRMRFPVIFATILSDRPFSLAVQINETVWRRVLPGSVTTYTPGVKLTVERRNSDYIAFLNGDRKIWGCGRTEASAVWSCLNANPIPGLIIEIRR